MIVLGQGGTSQSSQWTTSRPRSLASPVSQPRSYQPFAFISTILDEHSQELLDADMHISNMFGGDIRLGSVVGKWLIGEIQLRSLVVITYHSATVENSLVDFQPGISIGSSARVWGEGGLKIDRLGAVGIRPNAPFYHSVENRPRSYISTNRSG